jgi:PBP1b-binding outer membrane lipoprotein LpoB
MHRSEMKIPIMLVLLFTFLLQGCLQAKLLTTNVSEVQKMTITSGNRTSEITTEKEKDLIAQIYELINLTRTRTEVKPNGSNEQTSEPYYTITIDYSNGSKDTIYSTENGKFIYKRLSGNGWVGGNNDRLIEILDLKVIW